MRPQVQDLSHAAASYLIVALVIAVLVGLAGCTSQPPSPQANDPAAVEPESATAVEATVEPEQTADELSGDDAAKNVWTEVTGPTSFISHHFGEIWEVELTGIVRTGPPDDSSRACHVLFGTMVNRSDKDPLSGYGDGPHLGLQAGGEYLYPARRPCATSSLLLAAGYEPIDQAEITNGTAYAFFVEFNTDAPPEHVVVGPPADGDEQHTVVVDVTDKVVDPNLDQSGQVPLVGLQELSASVLQWEGLNGIPWSLKIDGLVRYDDGCVVIVGSLTPDAGSDLVVNSGDHPRFGLVVDGRYTRDRPDGCHEDEAEAAGYLSPSLRDLEAGKPYNFYASFHIPANGHVDAVVVGNPGSFRPAALFLTAPLSSNMATAGPVDSASASAIVLPPLAGSVGTATSQETTWEVHLDGMIETGRSSDEQRPGRCVDIYGTMAIVEIDGGGTVNSQWTVPAVGVLQHGALVTGIEHDSCANESVQAAGYRTIQGLNVAVGTVHPFYVTALVEDGEIGAAVVDSDNDDGILARADFSRAVSVPDMSWSTTTEFTTKPLDGTHYSYSDTYEDWEYEVVGIVEVDLTTADGPGGRCFAMFGTISPTRMSTSTNIANPGDAPPVALISADGYYFYRGDDPCDASAVTSAGYRALYEETITEGELVPFYVMVLLPEGREIDAVVVGRAVRPYSGGFPVLYLEPNISDEIVPAG